MRITTRLLLASLVTLPLLSQAQTPPTAAARAVLVTGASTGIGRKITEHTYHRSALIRMLDEAMVGSRKTH
jgi:hypothetical protein